MELDSSRQETLSDPGMERERSLDEGRCHLLNDTREGSAGQMLRQDVVVDGLEGIRSREAERKDAEVAL